MKIDCFYHLQLASKLGMSHDKYLKSALQRDEMNVMHALKELIMSQEGYETIIDMKASRYYAEWLLNLIDKVSSSCLLTPACSSSLQFREGPYRHILGDTSRDKSTDSCYQRESTNGLKCKLHRIDVELSTAADLFPSSLIVRDVRILDENSTRGGHFADVYKGELPSGTLVAVKKLRQIFHASTTRVDASKVRVPKAESQFLAEEQY